MFYIIVAVPPHVFAIPIVVPARKLCRQGNAFCRAFCSTTHDLSINLCVVGHVQGIASSTRICVVEHFVEQLCRHDYALLNNIFNKPHILSTTRKSLSTSIYLTTMICILPEAFIEHYVQQRILLLKGFR